MKFAVFALVLSVSLPGSLSAQSTMTNMLGPISPAYADMNQDGTVGEGDTPIAPERQDTETIILPNPWQSGISDLNTFRLSNPVGGRFQTVGRSHPSGWQQVTQLDSENGTPSLWRGTEYSSFEPIMVEAFGALLDTNNDGIFDTFSGSTSGTMPAARSPQTQAEPTNFVIPFLYVDTSGDGYGDYITIPWSQAQMVGVNFNNTVGGIAPQVFVPMADSNGDGRGDTIGFDFDGNGLPDSDLPQPAPGAFGPVLAPPSLLGDATGVPTASEWAMLFLIMTLGTLAIFQLRRHSTRTIRY